MERYGNAKARDSLSSRSNRSIDDELFYAALQGDDPFSKAVQDDKDSKRRATIEREFQKRSFRAMRK